jgi:energy-converting hydrogenase Eha subunit A
MNLMKQAIESGTDLDLLRLLASYDADDVIPTLAPIFDVQRNRCIRKGWARSVVTGTEITAKGLEALRG